jgi:hypothetical protein
MPHDDSVPDVLHFVQPPFHPNGHSSKPHLPVITVPRLAPQEFTHPEDGHWLKEPEGFERMLFQEPLSVTQVVYLVLKRTMQATGSLLPRELYYVKLSYAYFMRGGRMSRKSVLRGLREAVERGYLRRRPVGKQQWEYAVRWKGEQSCTDGHQGQKETGNQGQKETGRS